MAFYESTFIVRHDISQADVQKLVDQFSGIISENGGKVIKSEYWGLRNLAYRIKKNRKGHYAYLGLEAPAAAVQEMERNMRINEDVLRNITIKVEMMDKEPTVMMKGSDAGDEDDKPFFKRGKIDA